MIDDDDENTREIKIYCSIRKNFCTSFIFFGFRYVLKFFDKKTVPSHRRNKNFTILDLKIAGNVRLF